MLGWDCLGSARNAGNTFSDTSVPEKRAARPGSPARAALAATRCEALPLADAVPLAAREIPKAAPKARTTQISPVPTSLDTRKG